jgi:hypothetical protein
VTRDERLALNEALFRQVNERLLEISTQFGILDNTPEFVCECPDDTCTDRISLSVGDYERLRANPRQFVVLPGHEAPTVERIVADRGSYRVVEKVGVPGAIAEDTDPRD